MHAKLELEIIRGPLDTKDAEAVLSAYNRLAFNSVQQNNFKRWMCDSPSGAAVHALLRTATREIAGHVSIFPFPLEVFGQTVVGGKAEYLFVEPNYRKAVVRDYESSGQFPAIVLLKALYQYTREQLNWDPVLISAPAEVDAIHRHCGARSVAFPLTECLFIRRPFRAARLTPNLTTQHRVALLAIGLVQAILGPIYRGFTFGRPSCLKEVYLTTSERAHDSLDKIAFSQTAAYWQWRYPLDQFVIYQVGNSTDDFVIARRGSPTHYLRVCAAKISSTNVSGFRLMTDLVKECGKQRAIGVRWAVYQNGNTASDLVSAFRRIGALCAKRLRTMSVLTQKERCLDSASWIMEDSVTAFEH